MGGRAAANTAVEVAAAEQYEHDWSTPTEENVEEEKAMAEEKARVEEAEEAKAKEKAEQAQAKAEKEQAKVAEEEAAAAAAAEAAVAAEEEKTKADSEAKVKQEQAKNAVDEEAKSATPAAAAVETSGGTDSDGPSRLKKAAVQIPVLEWKGLKPQEGLSIKRFDWIVPAGVSAESQTQVGINGNFWTRRFSKGERKGDADPARRLVAPFSPEAGLALAEMFENKNPLMRKKKVRSKGGKTGSGAGGSALQHLLGPERQVVVSSVRKKLLHQCRPTLDDAALARAIGAGDIGLLSDKFELIALVLPSEDEQSLLLQYMPGAPLAAEAKRLGRNEAMLLRLLRVPRVDTKVKCLSFLHRALDKPERVRLAGGAGAGGASSGKKLTVSKPSFRSSTSVGSAVVPLVLDRDRGWWYRLLQKCICLETASLDLKISRPLQEIIAFVFEVGNYMNHGTSSGQAQAMSLMSLSQLGKIESTDAMSGGAGRSATLMHYIAAHALANNRALLKHTKDAVAEMVVAANLDTDQLGKDVEEFAAHVTMLVAECERAKKASALGGSYEGLDECTRDEEGRFARAEMDQACGMLKEKAVQLQEAHARAVTMFSSVLAFYGEEEGEGAVSPEAYFECVCSFVQKLNGAYHDNILKAAEEKKAKSKQKGKVAVTVTLNKVNGEALFKLNSSSSSRSSSSRSSSSRSSSSRSKDGRNKRSTKKGLAQRNTEHQGSLFNADDSDDDLF
jgi:hypothetical protein